MNHGEYGEHGGRGEHGGHGEYRGRGDRVEKRFRYEDSADLITHSLVRESRTLHDLKATPEFIAVKRCAHSQAHLKPAIQFSILNSQFSINSQ